MMQILMNIMNNQKSSVKSSSTETIQTKSPGDTAASKIPSDATIIIGNSLLSGFSQSEQGGVQIIRLFRTLRIRSPTGTMHRLGLTQEFQRRGSASGKDLSENALN